MEDLSEIIIIYFFLLIVVCIFTYPLLGYFGQFGEGEAVLNTYLIAFCAHTLCLCIIEIHDSKSLFNVALIFLYNIIAFFLPYTLGMVLLDWIVRTLCQLPFI
jgi:hypothetical protein